MAKRKNWARVVTVLAVVSIFAMTGCASLSSADKRHYANLKAHGITIDRPVGHYEKPNSAVAAGALNLLPGIGNFYLACGNGGDSSQAIYGALNLLTWPISILWAVPQGAIDANTLNKQDMIYYYQFDKYGKAEMEKINFQFD